MELIFERSREDRGTSYLPDKDVPAVEITSEYRRQKALRLPEIAEPDLIRHYTELSRYVQGVNGGFYPLGSCTMKYNPRIHEEIAGLPGFSGIHPLQPEHTAQGCMEVFAEAEKLLCSITGMDAMSFQPAAGAHGEWTGLLLIKAYHQGRKDEKRTKIIVPDSAHGTNPASATMAGYTVISIPSTEEGLVDLTQLKKVLGPDTAGLMLTNPSTAGLFEKNILTVTQMVHEAGGLVYYDGANMNAIMGMVRPGDMGFDVCHLNLHKTFSTPHGGGGPGSGPVGCKAFLAPYLPTPRVIHENGAYKWLQEAPESIGPVKQFYGHFLVVLRALTYILTLGRTGLKEASENAVLNANYLMKRLSEFMDLAFDERCMHEFVLTLEGYKKETGVSALDFAKGLIDYGMHPPTMYFPMIVHEALMVEPTETESKETLDRVADSYRELLEKGRRDPQALKAAPITTPVRRVDEVGAARNPKLTYRFEESRK